MMNQFNPANQQLNIYGKRKQKVKFDSSDLILRYTIK